MCGVSAAIATAAACRAKKEELTTAVGISLAFTVMMMVAMPPLIQAMGLGPVVGGAWVGGTIDSTGAVGAAGAMLGKEAEVVATTIKMIQNMLIGVVAFGVAVYWVTCVEYALWALMIGLLISNTTGVSQVLRAGARTELYMKTGLVLLGAEVLFGKLLALGLPGICVSWVVTPVVLIVTFWFGQRVLKMESAALNMVISADMSVCGVSAAIATAAACRAKKEELTTAVGISLAFTVMMMVAMPPLIRAMGLGPVVGVTVGVTVLVGVMLGVGVTVGV